MSYDAYCDRCDVFDHIEGSPECIKYFAGVEIPFQKFKREQIGKIVAAGDMPPDLYDSDGNGVTITSGTLLRLTDWTPHRPGFKAGNYWTVETLDGLYHGSQVYDYELSQPGVLDKLWIAQKEPDGPGS